MGIICSKQKQSSSGTEEQKKRVIIKPPEKDALYTRDQSWIGLKNLHNTCFINSVLQALSANNTFMGYLQLMEFLTEGSFAESLRTFLL